MSSFQTIKQFGSDAQQKIHVSDAQQKKTMCFFNEKQLKKHFKKNLLIFTI